MSRSFSSRIPARYLPFAALVAGRPDAAAVHLAGHAAEGEDIGALRAQVAELRAEVEQLREELSAAVVFVDRLSAAAVSDES